MTDIIELQELLGRAIQAVNVLGEAAMGDVVARNGLERELDKARGAFEMAAESRDLWKERAIQAGWFPILSLADLNKVMADDVQPWNPTVSSDGEPTTLSEAVGQALGTASMCWLDVGKAGVFDSAQAARVFEGIIVWLSGWADEVRREANEATAAKMSYHDDQTLAKVRAGLREYDPFADEQNLTDMITGMQNKGILFREREPSSGPVEAE